MVVVVVVVVVVVEADATDGVDGTCVLGPAVWPKRASNALLTQASTYSAASIAMSPAKNNSQQWEVASDKASSCPIAAGFVRVTVKRKTLISLMIFVHCTQ